ncbi:polysaccharide deacetylase family protein [Nakamurella endophytica]|uniref:NodB homology domain-containing protein n=1 Tax=Nakamurella endophytica TaxID=1748367 RepID=A0A917WDE4_9ACTN|nr:polysaccharide deacetylase family protein [Nakamurella endophytica]GGL94908.1 hypothetical protein GCM10011594_13390 [Nakamurella endophytica]
MTTARRVVLTFDNGPTPGVTEQVLDHLASRSLQAVFFMVGRDLLDPARRRLAESVKAAGHWIGNHTMTHSVLLGTDDSPDLPRREIAAASEVLGDLADERKLFRPWGGGGVLDRRLFHRRSLQFLADHGYTCLLWNSVPRDWEDEKGWPARARADIDAKAHTVVVLHDIPGAALAALPQFLDDLLDAGTEFTREFPEDCLAVDAGMITPVAEAYVQRSE